jgi:hypothetical protein
MQDPSKAADSRKDRWSNPENFTLKPVSQKPKQTARSRQDALAKVLRQDADGLSDREYDRIANVSETDVADFLKDVI